MQQETETEPHDVPRRESLPPPLLADSPEQRGAAAPLVRPDA